MSDENLLGRERMHRWRWNPAAMVREEFNVEPDAWQLEVLQLFPYNERLAMKACKGPGKTTVLAWLVLNFLATRPHSRVGCTSITGDNLSTNLWPEIAKWHAKSAFLSTMFAWGKTRVSHRVYPSTWFAVARTWPKSGNAEQQADALAGLHADYVMFVLDESGGIPQAVMATAEAVLATGIETKVVQAGNPTHTTGPLHRACTVDRALWKVVQITGDPDDPRRSPRIKVDWARQQIASYGRDNPWVMVNVLGEFPPSSINALLGVEDVEKAMRRHYKAEMFEWAQKRLGVDVARFGDDRTVIFPRQGLASFMPKVMRHQRTDLIAARVAKAAMRWGAEMILVDDSGHWGHGVIDNLIAAQFGPIPILGEDKAVDPRFKNRRAEMWMQMAEWVKRGGALPHVEELVAELTEPTYTFIGGQFMLEPKDQIKARLGKSPDLADALALTFAIEDMPGELLDKLTKHDRVETSDSRREREDEGAGVEHDADPWDCLPRAA